MLCLQRTVHLALSKVSGCQTSLPASGGAWKSSGELWTPGRPKSFGGEDIFAAACGLTFNDPPRSIVAGASAISIG